MRARRVELGGALILLCALLRLLNSIGRGSCCARLARTSPQDGTIGGCQEGSQFSKLSSAQWKADSRSWR